MIDQLIIGGKASYEDFGASLASRAIKQPAKKSIKETVPFSNITYDFSAINGELYWEERELEYIFEMLADTPAELETKKIAFANWVMNTLEEEIFDPFIKDYHFTRCTFGNIEYSDEDNIEKTTAKVTFTAYPYKVANSPKKYTRNIEAGGEASFNVINDSSHRLIPKITITGGGLTVYFGDVIYTVPEGEISDATFMLPVGTTAFKFTNSNNTVCKVEVSFFEEVF